jgi:hypothetical protein
MPGTPPAARAFPSQQQRGVGGLPPPSMLPPPVGGGDWRGGNPNALPPAEPDEPPIGSFALDHLPPAQLDDFSKSGGAAVPPTDSDTMAALNARKLRATERSGIDQQQWYFGSIARDDAAGLIANLAPGAFIVRTSSQPNSFALTFKHKSGEIQHGLLREVPQGWSIEGAPPYEATLEGLLKRTTVSTTIWCRRCVPTMRKSMAAAAAYRMRRRLRRSSRRTSIRSPTISSPQLVRRRH